MRWNKFCVKAHTLIFLWWDPLVNIYVTRGPSCSICLLIINEDFCLHWDNGTNPSTNVTSCILSSNGCHSEYEYITCSAWGEIILCLCSMSLDTQHYLPKLLGPTTTAEKGWMRFILRMNDNNNILNTNAKLFLSLKSIPTHFSTAKFG